MGWCTAASVHRPTIDGLRDYGTGRWEGGDGACDHKPKGAPRAARPDGGLQGGKATVDAGTVVRDRCPCGARRVDDQVGLEPTPAAYVERLVEVFREVRRVLRDDAVMFLNLGDSYASGGNGPGSGKQLTNVGANMPARKPPTGYKPKDLLGIPWMVAFALRADGWWLRQDIIWAKGNPMPESVRDRCTKAHEYVFMLSKSRSYYFDAEAIAEKATTEPHRSGYVDGAAYAVGPMDRGGKSQREDPDRVWAKDGKRNRRSVWEVTPSPYPGAHFAVMPPELVRPCVLAGTSERGACAGCGAPWRRVVEKAKRPEVAPSELDRYGDGTHGVHRKVGSAYQKWLNENPDRTVGWAPSCDCEGAGVVPCTVLDPFAGSGTTLAVAVDCGRRAVGVELNPAYVGLIHRRMRGITPSLV